MTKLFAFLTGVVVLTAPGASYAETKVEVKQLHMCCQGCADEVEEILKKVEGVSGVAAERKTRTAQFVATDAKVAQAALDALAAAGFHGVANDKTLAFKDDSGVTAGNVNSLTVTGFHNSCPGCVKSFRVALKKVPGVTGDDCKSKVTTCTVKGNFDAAALIKALNEEGFHVKVKQ
jgi:periplasmic mercuric ion binding protein